jgi:hypothetical protein
MELTTALQTLKREVSSDPVEDAADKLKAFLRWVRVLDVYAEIWPGQYHKDYKSGLGIWEIVSSFWEKLGRYFPIMEFDGTLDSDWEDWASEYIPYELANYYDEENVEEWTSLAARLFYDFNTPEADSWKKLELLTGKELPKPKELVGGENFDWKRFERGVKSLRGGKGFLKAFQMVRHETGFVLLDETYASMGECIDTWDAETVRGAIEQGKRTSQFQREAQRAIDYFDEHPEKLNWILERVVRLWMDCIRKTPA